MKKTIQELKEEIKNNTIGYNNFMKLYQETKDESYMRCAKYMERCIKRNECDLEYLERLESNQK